MLTAHCYYCYFDRFPDIFQPVVFENTYPRNEKKDGFSTEITPGKGLAVPMPIQTSIKPWLSLRPMRQLMEQITWLLYITNPILRWKPMSGFGA